MTSKDNNNFSSKNIQGKKFSDKHDLTNNKFQYYQAGIKLFLKYSLIILFCLLSIFISLALVISQGPVIGGLEGKWISFLIVASMLGTFLFSITKQGLTGDLLTVGIVSVISLILIAPLIRAGESLVVTSVFCGMFLIVMAFGAIIMFAFTITVLNVLSNRWVGYGSIIISIAVIVVNVPIIFRDNYQPPHQFDWLISIVQTIVILSVGLYIATRSLRRDPKFDSIRLAAIAFCSKCYSTSFRGVNLTNADFTGATLRNVDFTKANLTKTCFSNAQFIEYACIDKNHFLHNLKAQNLAITLDVNKLSDKNFNYLDLEGINLENANLQGASFLGANLKNANLSGADLSGANLKQAQLVGADLTGATLTGACIEDWGITKTTVLKNVKCEFIFLESKEEYDKHGHSSIQFQQQYPNNRKFEEGEFIKRSYLAWEKYEENKTTTMNFYASVHNAIGQNHGGIHNYDNSTQSDESH